MGNKAGKVALKPKDLAKLSTSSGFEPDHVKMLYAQFLSLKGLDEAASVADLTITLPEFQTALGYKGKESSIFVDRIFNLFDENGDGAITFEEFLHGIGVLTPSAAPEVKLKFTFQIYDADKKGGISKEDLRTMLSATLAEAGLSLTSAQLERMVGDTFTAFDLDRDGYINFAEYRNMCTLQPNVLKPLTLNVADLIKQAHADEAAAAAAAAAAGGAATAAAAPAARA